jgi:ribonuclease VapC
MMAVDASAILAILLREDDADAYASALAKAHRSVISAVNYWEVLVRAEIVFGAAAEYEVQRVLRGSEISIAPADADSAHRAAQAFKRFRGRPGGRLNLGDCFAYALAEREGDGLLFKGNDFPKTDVRSALT